MRPLFVPLAIGLFTLCPSGLLAQDLDWETQHAVVAGGPEAGLVARTGDIDNLGFGWPAGFDPFVGRSTPVHPFPWDADPEDPTGTDRIQVISGYVGAFGTDGYTGAVAWRESRPEPVLVEWPHGGMSPDSVWLQLFVDDVQPAFWKAAYHFSIDGQRIASAERQLNALAQTGPIGKLMTISIPGQYLSLFEDGRIELLIDDPETDIGDGFAIDFVRVLLNPKSYPSREGVLSGKVVDQTTGEPVPFATISTGTRTVTADAEGNFEMSGLPAGLAIPTATAPGYAAADRPTDVVGGEKSEVILSMPPRDDEFRSITEDMDRFGRATLPGLYFDIDSDQLRPESRPTLDALQAYMQANPAAAFVFEGHTDSQASAEHNLDLSERRANAVVTWLSEAGIDPDRMRGLGMGESSPVADNSTKAGRSLNRRVEIVKQ